LRSVAVFWERINERSFRRNREGRGKVRKRLKRIKKRESGHSSQKKKISFPGMETRRVKTENPSYVGKFLETRASLKNSTTQVGGKEERYELQIVIRKEGEKFLCSLRQTN